MFKGETPTLTPWILYTFYNENEVFFICFTVNQRALSINDRILFFSWNNHIPLKRMRFLCCISHVPKRHLPQTAQLSGCAATISTSVLSLIQPFPGTRACSGGQPHPLPVMYYLPVGLLVPAHLLIHQLHLKICQPIKERELPFFMRSGIFTTAPNSLQIDDQR